MAEEGDWVRAAETEAVEAVEETNHYHHLGGGGVVVVILW